jgi:hypothetical protein
MKERNMTPRGLIELTAVANNIEAWRDWNRVAEQAERAGHGALVIRYAPSGAAGWRTVDKARKNLESALEKMQP